MTHIEGGRGTAKRWKERKYKGERDERFEMGGGEGVIEGGGKKG
jgi:hypothetical protein